MLQPVAAVAAVPSSGIPSTFAAAIALDKVHHTVTLPIFKGVAPHLGKVWFILTESAPPARSPSGPS
jgi:hypothetical protein